MDTKTKLLAATGAVAVGAAAMIAADSLRRSDATGTPPTPAEAARFLTQASFGVTDADIAAVQAAGIAGWIDQQMAMAPVSLLAFMNTRQAGTHTNLEPHNFLDEYFWSRVTKGSDQLRQRMQFALSQIFVISRENQTIDLDGAFGTGNYFDILGNNAFGNFRTLLEQVTMNPMMGIWLSYVSNDKEDLTSGRHPDENYAREIMQLMTIGMVQLNPDGTPKRDGNGNTIPTYSHDDIAGLAKVFTGISWFSTSPNDGTFISAPNPFLKPMIFYPKHHSISQKDFLGVTIPATTTADPAGDVKIALDTLFQHPNVGPFIGSRLIQQFITSNPTPAYVARIAAVFADNGSGVRGDLGAVLKAILTDPEARDAAAAQASPSFGKLREPMIRLANWMRTFNATSKNTFYDIDVTSAPSQLSQGFMDAPSVFNFWRPGYVPPHTRMGDKNLVAPEFQVVNELTVAGYINYIQQAIGSGVGFNSKTYNGIDVSSAYTNEVALAQTPDALLDRLNLLLFYGQMSAGLRSKILTAVNAVTIPTGSAATPAKVSAALLNRAKLSIVLSMVSGEYLTQR